MGIIAIHEVFNKKNYACPSPVAVMATGWVRLGRQSQILAILHPSAYGTHPRGERGCLRAPRIHESGRRATVVVFSKGHRAAQPVPGCEGTIFAQLH